MTVRVGCCDSGNDKHISHPSSVEDAQGLDPLAVSFYGRWGEEVCLDLGNAERSTAKDFVRSIAKGFPSERDGNPEGKHGRNEVSSGSQRHTRYCSHKSHCDISCEFTHGMRHEPIAISLWPIRPRNGPDLDGNDPPRALRVSRRERIPTQLRPLGPRSRVRTQSPATRLGRPAL